MYSQTSIKFSLLLAVFACCSAADASNCLTNLTPTSLINLRWLALGGAQGAVGCPRGGEGPVTGRKGSLVSFDHGQIAWSLDQGPASVIAVYQQDEDLIVNWGNTRPFNYDFFIALVKKNGKPFGQWDIKSYVERTRGFWIIPVDGPGLYTVDLEGCDNGAVSSTCRQSWMIPVSAQYTPPASPGGIISTPVFEPANAHYEIDFRAVQPRRAGTMVEAEAGEVQRSQIISSYNACRLKPLATQSYFKDEEDFVTVSLGKLMLASLSHGEVACKDVPGNYPRLSLRAEVNHAIRRQTIESAAGTSVDLPILKRTGEYDIMLRGYITMYYRFGSLLAPDTKYHLIQLLNKRGADYRDDLQVRMAPETENHILQIETSRFLTNQLLAEGNIEDLFGEKLDPTSVKDFNNATNGLRRYILSLEQQLLTHDFQEYNARPYQNYALPAVLNLAEFSHDAPVRETASMLLNYLAAKYAVSTNMGRRNPPYRRRVSHYFDSLLDGESDPAKELFNYYTGEWEQVDLPANAYDPLRLPGRTAAWLCDILQVAAVSTWRPSPFIYVLMMNRNHKPYFQRIHHAGVEIYDAEPNFTISSGGYYVDPVSSLLMFGADDAGPGLQTVLIPYGEGTNIRGMIRIEGFGQVRKGEDKDPAADSSGSSTTDHGRANTCVAPGFACGIDPAVPPEYLSPGKPNCWLRHGGWTFIDRASMGCTPHPEAGYYAAVYGQSENGFNFGFFEARQATPGLSFPIFREKVAIGNQNHTWKVGENTYTTSDGRQVIFVIDQPGQNQHTWPIRRTGIPVIDNGLETNTDKWPLVQGDVLALVEGKLTIKDPTQGKALIFNLTDPNNPKEELLPMIP